MLVITPEHAGDGLNWLENKARQLGDNLEKYGVIYHDLDTANIHYHVALKLKQPTRLSTIAKQFEQAENLVKLWRRNEDNLWAYIAHNTKNAKAEKVNYTPYLNNPNKSRFDSDDTRQQCTYDTNKSLKSDNAKIEKICLAIITGQLTERDLLAPEQAPTYWKHMTKIEKAIKIRNKTLRLYPPTCKTILITGDSGTGKTRYAIELAKQLYPKTWLMASAGNDPLQDYTGEKCIIFDDWRPQDYQLQDLLALLDPNYRQRTHKSRYYNKPLATELILITTNLTLDNIINHYTGYNNEDPKQIRRRIHKIITMQQDYTAIIETYDEVMDGWRQPI
jgi:DNA replication protein DnaC